MVLVALSQTGDVQGPRSTTVHRILWDVCDLVISKVIAAQLKDSDSEVLHTSSHCGGLLKICHLAGFTSAVEHNLLGITVMKMHVMSILTSQICLLCTIFLSYHSKPQQVNFLFLILGSGFKSMWAGE